MVDKAVNEKRIAEIVKENESFVAEHNAIQERLKAIPGFIAENNGRIKELKKQMEE